MLPTMPCRNTARRGERIDRVQCTQAVLLLMLVEATPDTLGKQAR